MSPYIKQDRRVELDTLIKRISNLLQDDGEINYTITRLIDNHYGSGSYVQLSAGMGVLSCVAFEFYRRRIAPYENKKCLENGEVFK